MCLIDVEQCGKLSFVFVKPLCFLIEISAIKLAHKKQAELARRKATPIVGDMRTLADALPELHPFIRVPTSKKLKGYMLHRD